MKKKRIDSSTKLVCEALLHYANSMEHLIGSISSGDEELTQLGLSCTNLACDLHSGKLIIKEAKNG